MVEIQAAERCELPGMIPELPTELRGPRIGSADVGMALELFLGQVIDAVADADPQADSRGQATR